MPFVAEQLNKIDKSIIQAKSILTHLKRRSKTEILEEQIEYYESLLNKLGLLKDSYLQLSSQFELSNKLSKPLSSINLPNMLDLDMSIIPTSTCPYISEVRNSITPETKWEMLLEDLGRYKELEDENSIVIPLQYLTLFENVAADTNNHSLSDSLDVTLIGDTNLDLSFYLSKLNHYIDIGSKVIELTQRPEMKKTVRQSVIILRNVIETLTQLRERFRLIVYDVRQFDMPKVSQELKTSFVLNLNYFKSVMDIIQISVTSDEAEIELEIESRHDWKNHVDDDENIQALSIVNGHQKAITEQPPIECPYHQINKRMNNRTGSIGNLEASDCSIDGDDDENVDNDQCTDEGSIDSCYEKDQDESMEMGTLISIKDTTNNHMDHDCGVKIQQILQMDQKNVGQIFRNSKYESGNFKLQQKSDHENNENMFQDDRQEWESNNDIRNPTALTQSKSQRLSLLALHHHYLSNNFTHTDYDRFYESDQKTTRNEDCHINHVEQQMLELLNQSQVPDIIKRTENDSDSYQSLLNYRTKNKLSSDQRHRKKSDSQGYNRRPTLADINNNQTGKNLNQYTDLNSTLDSCSYYDTLIHSPIKLNSNLSQAVTGIGMATNPHWSNHDQSVNTTSWNSTTNANKVSSENRFSHLQKTHRSRRSPSLPVSDSNESDDEISRLGPVRQSSIFVGNKSKSCALMCTNNVCCKHFMNLKNQVEEISAMCQKMSLDQNRMAHDLSQLKRAASPWINNNSNNHNNDGSITSSADSYQQSYEQNLPSNENNRSWIDSMMIINNTEKQPLNIAANIKNWTSGNSTPFKPLLQIDPNNRCFSPDHQSELYRSQVELCQNFFQQQSTLTEAYSNLMKWQMSLIGSSFDFLSTPMTTVLSTDQNLVTQKNQHCQFLPLGGSCTGLVPAQPFYPPSGCVPLTNCDVPILHTRPASVSGFQEYDHHSYPKLINPANRGTSMSHLNGINMWNQFSAIGS